MKVVGLPKNFDILDVGCGTGMLAKRLKEYGFNNIDGTDWLESQKVDFLDELNTNKN